MRSGPAREAEIVAQEHTILLVEDDPETLDLTAMALRNAGYKVFTAAHEDAAIRCVLEHPQIEVIITDACYGDGGSGMCMAEEVRRCGSAAAVVVTSADPHASCATLGDDAMFLLKPYGCKALLGVVAAALAQSRAVVAPQEPQLRSIA